MYYILNDDVALRSWHGIPHAYITRGSAEIHGLDESEFFTLLKCDGETELSPNEISLSLPIHSCRCKEESLSPWQELKVCDNRCFPSINWMITGKCNYNCLHCFNASDNVSVQSEFTLREACKLIDEAAGCGVIAFMLTGGEPMLHRDFFTIIKKIYEAGMYVSRINTNGSFIDEHALTEFNRLGCLPLMKISFDGLGFHDTMRGVNGAEERTLSAIKLCKEHGLRVMVQTNVNRSNLSVIPETIRAMSLLGVDTMRIIRTSESPRWEQKGLGNTLSFDEYYEAMLDLMSKYSDDMTLDIWQMLLCENGHKSITAIKMSGKDDVVCRGNRRMAAIGADGELFPCNQLSGWFESRNISLGNVKKTPLRELFTKSRYLDAVCTTVGEIESKNSECISCHYRAHCAGGCRALACISDGSYYGRDKSKCIFFKNGWYDKARQLL